MSMITVNIFIVLSPSTNLKPPLFIEVPEPSERHVFVYYKGNMMPTSSIYGVYKSVHKPFGLMWTMS
jgi:hypothetical protein